MYRDTRTERRLPRDFAFWSTHTDESSLTPTNRRSSPRIFKPLRRRFALETVECFVISVPLRNLRLDFFLGRTVSFFISVQSLSRSSRELSVCIILGTLTSHFIAKLDWFGILCTLGNFFHASQLYKQYLFFTRDINFRRGQKYIFSYNFT